MIAISAITRSICMMPPALYAKNPIAHAMISIIDVYSYPLFMVVEIILNLLWAFTTFDE
jgi:hypothetical protein